MLEFNGKYNKDCIVYNDYIEETCYPLIYDIVNHPAFENQVIRIMPDTHAGKGIVVGFTSTIGDYVNPDHVGCDIGCTITSIITPIKVDEIDLALTEHRIRKEVKFGFDLQNKKVFEEKEMYRFLNSEMMSAHNSWCDMISNVNVDENYIFKLLKRIGMDEAAFYHSIGTVGGGNHFIELGDDNGNVVLTIHCGSRNFGLKTWLYWHNKAQNGGDYNGYLSGENLSGYLTDMAFAQAYAKYNHKIITDLILNNVLSKKHKFNKKDIEVIQSIHNYIDLTNHYIRKGAISAQEGQMVVIPFNMRDGLCIARGLGNKDWNYSAPHGSGRKMSRSQAKENISVDEFKKSMEGIYSTCVGKGTLDESPQAYKDTETIINLINNTVEIVKMVKPIINLKASNSKND